MAIEYDVVKFTYEISKQNLAPAYEGAVEDLPDPFEVQLKNALNVQNAGTYDDWELTEYIEVPYGSSKKSIFLVFKRNTT